MEFVRGVMQESQRKSTRRQKEHIANTGMAAHCPVSTQTTYLKVLSLLLHLQVVLLLMLRRELLHLLRCKRLIQQTRRLPCCCCCCRRRRRMCGGSLRRRMLCCSIPSLCEQLLVLLHCCGCG